MKSFLGSVTLMFLGLCLSMNALVLGIDPEDPPTSQGLCDWPPAQCTAKSCVHPTKGVVLCSLPTNCSCD